MSWQTAVVGFPLTVMEKLLHSLIYKCRNTFLEEIM
jgi:hypothetical protein